SHACQCLSNRYGVWPVRNMIRSRTSRKNHKNQVHTQKTDVKRNRLFEMRHDFDILNSVSMCFGQAPFRSGT
ncbi:MAG: hypothetical protein WA151_21080, partial [Desulfatirhabdiaceae bacterium]